jgi:hypothetical protein
MASCYHCGRNGASYRRKVQTGQSQTSWTSKKSYGSSSRTYYGLRTVCEDCAISIDTTNAVLATIVLFLLACGLLYYLVK